MEINNQKEYWNKVAGIKTFTQPIDTDVLNLYLKKDFKILDYGCGYGRISNELYSMGYTDIKGADTSVELLKRGKQLYPQLNFVHINQIDELNKFTTDFDTVILFAVLTCIPGNDGQKELINMLYNRLKKGGLIYISDYYLQTDRYEVKNYTTLNDDENNSGVFTLPEGVTFRHHTREWIKELLQNFDILSEKTIEVKTMNGHIAEAFQIIARK